LQLDIVSFLRAKLNNSDFVERHRFKPSDFTRECRLTFDRVVLFLINFVKGALQRELDDFFQALFGSDFSEKVVTKSAFSAARHKLKPSAFVELNNDFLLRLYRQAPIRRWRGLDLRSVDGTTLRLPDKPEVTGYFGQMVPAQGNPVTMARVSQLYDPLNHLVHDAVIDKYSCDERSLLVRNIEKLCPGSLLLLDAGYPAFWLFSQFRSKKIDWCVRMPLNSWTIVQDFLATRKNDIVVTLNPTSKMMADCIRHNVPEEPIRVRLIRVILSTGETEVLMTSLLDINEYDINDFSALYFLRWGHEEHYKRFKARMEVEFWTGNSVLSIFQDFFAKVFSLNLTMALVNIAQETVDACHANDKHPKQVNVAHAICAMKGSIVTLLNRSNPFLLLRNLIMSFAGAVEAVRSERSYPRRQGHHLHRRHMSYKPCT